MAIYFKFKSSVVTESVPVATPHITVRDLKGKIMDLKFKVTAPKRRGNFDLLITNSQTQEDYLDEETLIPRNTSVLVRRVPFGGVLQRIVTQPIPEQDLNANPETLPSQLRHNVRDSAPDLEDYRDEETRDLVRQVTPGRALKPIVSRSIPEKDLNANPQILASDLVDEDSKIKALVETPSLDWQHQSSAAASFGLGRGNTRGIMMGGRGFSHGASEQRKPPEGYVCHRCKVPGHFIQHCPTNGDPAYDFKRVRRPTGVSQSMSVLKPDEAAFEREIEGVSSSSRSSGSNIPPELYCPLCKQVMRYAVFTSKCCFNSFCDTCIREHIISKSMCVCGATNVLADDLLPNKTVRDTIDRMLESNSSSRDSISSISQVQAIESRNSQPKTASPKHPVASNEELMTSLNQKEETLKVIEVEKQKHELVSAPLADQDVEHKPAADQEVEQKPAADQEDDQKSVSSEGPEKKKKKACLPSTAAETQWGDADAEKLAAENYKYMMSTYPGPAAYNQYWTAMQPGMEAFMHPYGGAFSYMPYGGVFPQYPYGGQASMMPLGPSQRSGLGEFGQPALNRREDGGRKANLKRKHQDERHAEGRKLPRDYERRSMGSPNRKASRETLLMTS